MALKPAAKATSVENLLAAERLRVSAILESMEGKARPTLAAALALRSGMSTDEALAILKTAAPERHASAAESFAHALQAEAIGLTVLGAGPTGDPKEARLREIRANVGKGRNHAA